MKIRYILPLILFLLVGLVLWRGLGLHPEEIPTPLLDKAAPTFEVPGLINPQETLSNKNFVGHVSIFNVWASWCGACMEEHDLLVELSKEPGVIFYGLDYKDDSQAAQKVLREQGNPYRMVGSDIDGQVAIDWGVYGTPELFIIDKHGKIRFKHIGTFDQETWENSIKPILDKLQNEV